MRYDGWGLKTKGWVLRVGVCSSCFAFSFLFWLMVEGWLVRVEGQEFRVKVEG